MSPRDAHDQGAASGHGSDTNRSREGVAATDLPSSIGMNPMDHPWVATGDDRDADVVVYVVCITEREPRLEFAHILFEADWGDREQADHIVKLHNDWLEARRAGGSAERYRRAAS